MTSYPECGFALQGLQFPRNGGSWKTSGQQKYRASTVAYSGSCDGWARIESTSCCEPDRKLENG